MDSEVREVLLGVQNGSMSVDQALLHLKQKPFEDIGYAMVDLHRRLRQGAGEVIYGAGKTAQSRDDSYDDFRRHDPPPISHKCGFLFSRRSSRSAS